MTHTWQTEDIQTTRHMDSCLASLCLDGTTRDRRPGPTGHRGDIPTITDPPGFMSGKPGARTVHMETPRPAIATADRTGSWATFSQSLRHMIHVWQPCARTVRTEAPRDVIATKDRTATPHSLRHKGSCNHRLTWLTKQFQKQTALTSPSMHGCDIIHYLCWNWHLYQHW